mmetsp:Transcript_32412/g.61033  ORF Transcript_32412/g.61033 Transcript_32412/m.61033 type:complete len:122 (-) Transcript_32412:527-892(-)
MIVYMAKLLLQCTRRSARNPGFFNVCSGKNPLSTLGPEVGKSTQESSDTFRTTSVRVSLFVMANPNQRIENPKLTVPKIQKLALQPACEQMSGARTEATICPNRNDSARAAKEQPRSDAGT